MKTIADRVRQLGDPAVAALLESGATDAEGNTALHVAARGNSADIVQAIVEAGGVAIDALNKEGMTALGAVGSLYKPNADIARVLVDHGAQIDLALPFVINPLKGYKSPDEQRALLDVLEPRLMRPWTTDELIGLIYMREVPRFEAAFAKGVDVRDVGKRFPETFLHAAVFIDHLDLVRKLLAAGADPTSNTAWGTPLHHGGGVEVAELLLAAGADVNAIEVTIGATPLMTVVLHRHFEKGELLIDRGAHVNAVNNRNETVLHIMATWPPGVSKAMRRLFKRLGAAGIDLEARDADGKTAHDLAKGAIKTQIARMHEARHTKPKRSAKKPKPSRPIRER